MDTTNALRCAAANEEFSVVVMAMILIGILISLYSLTGTILKNRLL